MVSLLGPSHGMPSVMFYVYVLKSAADDSIYVGRTDNLKRRFEEHNKGKSKSTKFKTPLQLVYYEAYGREADAKLREWNLKRHAGAMTHLKKRIRNSLA